MAQRKTRKSTYPKCRTYNDEYRAEALKLADTMGALLPLPSWVFKRDIHRVCARGSVPLDAKPRFGARLIAFPETEGHSIDILYTE